ncbi:MAG: chemotaxis protein CheW [Phycisphaeraceae bacterium]|nr:chemotaxis protein CheW [Phycisphaeraceae bacterium]
MEVLIVVLAGRRYALPSARVEEIVARTKCSPIPGAPDFVVGLIDHRGSLLPVIDGCRLIHGEPAASILGSRIIILRLVMPTGGQPEARMFGLLCDLVLERTTINVETGAWRAGRVTAEPLPISAVGRVNGETIPLIDPEHLLRSTPLLDAPAVDRSISRPDARALEQQS